MRLAVSRALRLGRHAAVLPFARARCRPGCSPDPRSLANNQSAQSGDTSSGEVVGLLKEQFRIKDEQIAELLQRDKDRNMLLPNQQGSAQLSGIVEPRHTRR